MKKVVPLKKDIEFKSNLAEIISISLDHELKLESRVIRGNLIIGGSYKMNDVSINTEEFKYNIPVNIEMSDKYILDNLVISIDDFYYEIIDNKILSVNIEIGLDNLDEVIEPVEFNEEPILDMVEETEVPDERNITSEVKTLFNNFDESTETYSTYQICIVKEGDSLESIMIKYGITKEIIEEYNDVTEIKIGDKLIIPSIHEAN